MVNGASSLKGGWQISEPVVPRSLTGPRVRYKEPAGPCMRIGVIAWPMLSCIHMFKLGALATDYTSDMNAHASTSK